MFELKRALSSAHNTSPGPDGISHELLRHLNEDHYACRLSTRLRYHRSQYSRYSAIYTDGSKRADYVGCGVVIEDIMHGYRLDISCSIFTAEAVAIYRALQLIDSTMPRKYCIYTDSMSVHSKRLKKPRSLPSSGMYQYSTLRVDSTARVSISCFPSGAHLL
ncbi:pggt1b [Trichonephila clavipes]|nr:pggt1b [Trichonephila clavipes]